VLAPHPEGWGAVPSRFSCLRNTEAGDDRLEDALMKRRRGAGLASLWPMTDHPHTIDRWDDTTGETLSSRLPPSATTSSRTASSQWASVWGWSGMALPMGAMLARRRAEPRIGALWDMEAASRINEKPRRSGAKSPWGFARNARKANPADQR